MKRLPVIKSRYFIPSILGFLIFSVSSASYLLAEISGGSPNVVNTDIRPFQRTDVPLNERLAVRGGSPDLADKIKRSFGFYLSQSVEYDDNLFQAPRSQAESDVIFSSAAGVHFDLIRKEHPKLTEDNRLWLSELRVGFSYLLIYRTYVSHSNLSGFDQILNTDLNFPLEKILGKKLTLRLRDTFRPEPLIIFEGNNQNNQNNQNNRGRRQREYRLVNDFEATLAYPITGKTLIEVPYQNTYTHYLSKRLREFDSVRHKLGTRVTYDWTQKTSFFGEGDIVYTHYNNSSLDSLDYIARTGINKQINEKIRTGASGGFQYRHPLHGGSDVRTYIFEGTYDHKVSEKTDFGFNAFRAITESLSVANDFNGVRNFDESIQDQNPTLITTGFNGHVNKFWAPRFGSYGRAGVTYTEEKSGSGRKDFFYIAQTGLVYYFRYNLTLNFDYMFVLRNSNENDSDYYRNRFILSLNYGFGGIPFMGNSAGVNNPTLSDIQSGRLSNGLYNA